MNYYLYYRDGAVVGWNATEGVVGSSAVEVSLEAYLAAGGTLPPDEGGEGGE